MQETHLYERWKELALSSEILQNGSQTLQVLRAGELNQICGPDFRQARFKLNGAIYQGDVECHTRLAYWYGHQHHLDRAYANVLLHIIPEGPDHPEPVQHRQCCLPIPSFCLPANHTTHLPHACPLPRVNASALLELGLERFHFKMHYFLNQLAIQSAEQVFYENFFRALGYSVNADTFQLMAKRLPYSWLYAQLKRTAASADIFALYAGSAGFLPQGTKDAFVSGLIKRFHVLKPTLDNAPLEQHRWQFAAVKPCNHPHFRLASWTKMLEQNGFPLAALQTLLESRLPFEQLKPQILAFFKMPCLGYWRSHYALDKSTTQKQNSFFFGIGRINEIVQNLLLPYFAAKAQSRSSTGFLNYLEDIYCHWPGSGPYNQVKKQFPFLEGEQKLKPSLALDQGLLYLKHHYCDRAKCASCPIQM